MKKLMLMAAIMALAAGGVSAGIINVDVNDPACVPGTGQPDPYAVVYCSIQDAVTDATSGDVINVAAGTYVEQVTIDKTLNLLGAGESVTTIQAPAADRLGSVTEDGNIWDYIVAAYPSTGTIDVRVEGFTIDANGENKSSGAGRFAGVFFRDVDGINAGLLSSTIQNFGTNEFENWGIWVCGASDLTIDDNTLSGYTRDGIVVNGDGGPETDPNAVISNNDLTGSAIPLNGIQLSRGATGTISGNTVRDHTRSSPWAAVGIMVYESNGITVNGGNIVENCWDGIVLLRSDGSTVSGNTLTDNIAFHIGLDESDNNQVSANTITGTTTGTEDKAISLSNGATGNTIGGSEPADGNNITLTTSGSGLLYGIYIQSTVGAGSNTIQYNTFNGGTRFVQVDGGNSGTTTVADNTVTGCSFAGLYLNAGSVVISGNTLTNTVRPVEFWGAHDVTISENIMDGSTYDGINCGSFTGSVTIPGNAIYNIPGLAIHNRTTTQINASGNWLGTNTPAGVAAEVSDYVDYTPWLDVGTDTEPGTPGFQGDFSVLDVDDDSPQTGATGRIQEGIDLVTGSTVNVMEGTYHNDPTDVNKQVTLLGANADIDPAGSTDRGGETILTRDDTQSGFYVTASGVTINGFKLGTYTPQSSRRVRIHGATDVTIKYNIIMNTWEYSGHGVYIGSGSDRAEILYNTIDNPWWEGIRNDGASDVVISNNTVRDVDNFPILTSGKAIISGNTVLDCKDGIRVDYVGTGIGDRVEVTGNTVSYTKYAGINITGTHAYVYNNTIHHCNYYGSDGTGDWDYASIHMEASATNCIIEGNTVYDGINGVQTWANDVTITNNEVYDMGVTYADEKIVGSRTYKNSGILVGSNWGSGDIDPTGVVIQGNSIHDNYWNLFYSADLSNGVDASGNWLGDNTPSGVAAQVSGNVDYTPWLDVGTDIEPGTPGFQGDFSVLDVDDDSPQSGTTGRIQESVDLVTGSTVNVAAGTYEAQVVIGKELTLVGAGKDVTVIQSPTTLTEYFTTSADNYPIVYIHDADATVQDFTIDGLGRGNANYRFVGIGFWNAGGSITNVDLTGVRDTPFSGAQHGVSIYAYNTTGGPYTVNITDVNIDDMQKNGMALNGNGLTANATSCSVAGQGPTSVTAQNGIQIGYGAGGTVTNCTVTGVGYTGESWTATAMLFYNSSSVNLSGGNVSGSQTSVMYQETQGAIDGITITSTTITGTAISIPDYGSIKAAAENTALKPASPFEEENKNGAGLKGGPTNVTIDSVILTGVHEPGSYGIAAWAIGDDVNVTITKSTIQDWGIGVVAKDSVGSVTVVADSNTISGNDFGVWTNAASAQDFENNNWGASDGPEDPDGTAEVYIGQCYSVDSMKNTVAEFFPIEGLGNSVSDNVDYCPWIPWSCCVVRSDVDHSGAINVVDLTYLVDYLFFEGPAPPCFEEGDVDGSTAINVVDLTYLVDYLFFSGPPPPPC